MNAYATALALFNELQKIMPHPRASVLDGLVQDINFCDASAQGYRSIMQYRNVPREGEYFSLHPDHVAGHIQVYSDGRVQYLGKASEVDLATFFATWNNFVIEYADLCTRLGIKLTW